jgi:PHP family Zn ribbon phosphoesterase
MKSKPDCDRCSWVKPPQHDLSPPRCPGCGADLAKQVAARAAKVADGEALGRALRRLR